MVDINEASVALDKTPPNNLKQKFSFVHKLFFAKDGTPKRISIINYTPGFTVAQDAITVVRNMRIKLKKNYILEQDFVIIPSRAGNIYIPLKEFNLFSCTLSSLVTFIGNNNENKIK